VRQMKQANLDATLIAGDGLANPDFWAITGESGTGTLFTFAPDPSANPQAADLVRNLRARNIEPALFTLNSYAAMQVLAQAVAQAGEPEPPAVSDALRQGRFETVIGTLDFNEKGDLTNPSYVIYKWAKGGYVPASAAAQ
jgi:branched-chain amino acid transport system substrate-binding protein